VRSDGVLRTLILQSSSIDLEAAEVLLLKLREGLHVFLSIFASQRASVAVAFSTRGGQRAEARSNKTTGQVITFIWDNVVARER